MTTFSTLNIGDIHDDVIISHVIPHLFSHEIIKEKSILKCRVDPSDISAFKDNKIIFKKLGNYYDNDRGFSHIGILLSDYLKCKTNRLGRTSLFGTTNEINFKICGDIDLSCASQTLIRTIKFICSLRLININFNRLLSPKNISHALNMYFLRIVDDNIKLPLLNQACSFAYNSIEVTQILIESAVEKPTHLNFLKFINSGTHLFNAIENGNINTVNFFLSSVGEYVYQMISNVQDTNTILDYAILTSNPSIDIITTIIKMYGDRARDLILRQFPNGETIFHRYMRECDDYKRESLDIRHNIFKILIQVAGPKVLDLFRIKNTYFNFGLGYQTIVDVARRKLNWEIMLGIQEIETEILDEAYQKEYWPIVSDILRIHAKQYGQKHGVKVAPKRVADYIISISRKEKKASSSLLEYFKT